MRTFILLLSGLTGLSPAFAQQRVDDGNSYYRVLAVVPNIGNGTWADPKRPMFAPMPGQPADRTGIIGFQHQLSDDGAFSLIELVAANRAALTVILTSPDPSVKVFEVGKHAQAEIAAVFVQYKAAFSFASFQPVRIQ